MESNRSVHCCAIRITSGWKCRKGWTALSIAATNGTYRFRWIGDLLDDELVIRRRRRLRKISFLLLLLFGNGLPDGPSGARWHIRHQVEIIAGIALIESRRIGRRMQVGWRRRHHRDRDSARRQAATDPSQDADATSSAFVQLLLSFRPILVAQAGRVPAVLSVLQVIAVLHSKREKPPPCGTQRMCIINHDEYSVR